MDQGISQEVGGMLDQGASILEQLRAAYREEGISTEFLARKVLWHSPGVTDRDVGGVGTQVHNGIRADDLKWDIRVGLPPMWEARDKPPTGECNGAGNSQRRLLVALRERC